MTDIDEPSLEERLWHKMRADLVEYVPDILAARTLMCCCCGRFLERDDFDLEHLIPQRVLKNDPEAVRKDPDTPRNVRAGNLLLCKKPLKIDGRLVYKHGCNSWKGRFYDGAIEELFADIAFDRSKARHGNDIGTALCLGYLAMAAKFGYRVALMPSGLLVRRQFFQPHRLNPGLPWRSQMLLFGSLNEVPTDSPMWGNPFSFSFVDGACCVAARSFSVFVPATQDPRLPIARHLRIVPNPYKLRPDFSTVFG